MKRFAIISSFIALLSGFLLKGTFVHSIIVYAAGMYLGPPLILFMALWFVIGLKRTGTIPAGLRNTFLVSLIVGGTLLVSLGVGRSIHRWEIREVRLYVTKMVPKLDEYKRENGRYPESLSNLNAPSPPKLLKNAHSYSADADVFRFSYWDPAGMMDGYCFDSATREWHYFD